MTESIPAAEMFPNFLAEETSKMVNNVYVFKCRQVGVSEIYNHVSLIKNPTPSLGQKRRARRARRMRLAAKARAGTHSRR
jgi:hypothetical protein